MKSIEDLYFEKTILKKERNSDGTIVEVPQLKKTKRDPIVVSQGVRFGYYIIDLVVYYALSFVVGFIIALINPFLLEGILLNVISVLILFSYYTLMEGLVGATIGKLILGYTVIDVYAEKPSFSRVMLRSVCRLVPFEAFSCLGERGWHDQWSKTYVVHKSERAELQKFLGNINHSNELLD